MLTVDPIFELFPVRFEFLARAPIHFPAGKPANTLRGAFGTIFKRIACTPDCRDARLCLVRESCAYARIFEPRKLDGPSGLVDLPRPFVFRARHLDGKTFSPGQSFHFDVHIFDQQDPALAYFVLTFAEIARQGLGPQRGIADLRRVDLLDAYGSPSVCIFKDLTFLVKALLSPLRIDLRPDSASPPRIRVEFLTPTELKSENELAARPEFGILFARIRDRVATLAANYGRRPLPIDFRALGGRATGVKLVTYSLRRQNVERRSSRTHQVHGVGGFLGFADYEGDLGELFPYLRAACWTGIGRHTTFGNGEIAVTKLYP